MRALILHGAGDLRLEDVPDPRPAPGEVVVRVLAALTCATDAKMMRVGAHPALGRLPAPLGHEVAGVVEAVGAGRRRARGSATAWWWPTRPRAASAPTAAPARPTCARGSSTSPGPSPSGCGSRPRSSPATSTRLPDGLAPEAGAFAEPLACALHSVRRCGPAGDREVVVLGGGVQGQLLAALLARGGDRVHLADPHAERRARALRLGAVAAHEAPRDPAAARGLWPRASAAAGDPTSWSRPSAGPRRGASRWSWSGPAGVVLLHGGCPVGSVVELPTERIHYSEITLRGSFHHTPEAFARALAMIAAGEIPVDEFLHPPIALDEVAAALAASPGVKHPVMPR